MIVENPTQLIRRLAQSMSSRSRVALLGAVVSVCLAAPATSALAEGPAVNAKLTVGGGGRSVPLLHRMTVPQLAALLGTSPAGLFAQIELDSGQSEVAACVTGLLTNPTADVGQLIDCLAGGEVGSGAIEQAIEDLLGPLVSEPEGLRATIGTILKDVEANGELGAVAGELGIPVAELPNLALAPVTPQAAAAALGTGAEALSETLRSVGAIASGLVPDTPMTGSPVALPGGGLAELFGLSGPGGVGLTTVRSTSTTLPGSTTVLGYTSASVDNAFSIVSVKLNRAGRIVETVRLPRAGRLSISANGKATFARRRSSRARNAGVKIAPVAQAVAAGLHSFVLRPRPGLGAARRTTVSLVTSYKPTGGTANTKHKTVTFRRKTKGANR